MKDPYKTLADKPEKYEVDIPGHDIIDAAGMGIAAAFRPPMMSPTAGMIGAVPVPITEDGINYTLTTELGQTTLRRGIDFGMVPKAKKPSLFKAGAERIATQLGLLQHYTIETAEEHFTDKPAYCYYRVRCDLAKIGPQGQEYVICTGYGSANTLEKRNGQNDVWNAANSTLKMASKRALVAAALSVASASGLFYQDLEDQEFGESGTTALKQTNDPNASLTMQQLKHIYARAAEQGLTVKQAQAKLRAVTKKPVKELKLSDYEVVLGIFKDSKENEDEG